MIVASVRLATSPLLLTLFHSSAGRMIRNSVSGHDMSVAGLNPVLPDGGVG